MTIVPEIDYNVPALNIVEDEKFPGVEEKVDFYCPVPQRMHQGNLNVVPTYLKENLKEYQDLPKSGSYGFVKKVYSPLIGAAALKKQFASLFKSERKSELWRREFEAAYFLNHHPHIVTLYGYVYEQHLDSEPSGILMEFMMGGTLHDCVNENITTNKLTPKIVNTWAKQIALGLNFIHSRNIMHRDLKPDNILLNQNRLIAKISDFGFVRKIDSSSKITNGVGNPCYAAPEVYMETENYTMSADVWSYGMVLYFIYYLKHPYQLEDIRRISPHVRVRIWLGETKHKAMPLRPLMNGYDIDPIIGECWKTMPAERCSMSTVVDFFHSKEGVNLFPTLVV